MLAARSVMLAPGEGDGSGRLQLHVPGKGHREAVRGLLVPGSAQRDGPDHVAAAVQDVLQQRHPDVAQDQHHRVQRLPVGTFSLFSDFNFGNYFWT